MPIKKNNFIIKQNVIIAHLKLYNLFSLIRISDIRPPPAKLPKTKFFE